MMVDESLYNMRKGGVKLKSIQEVVDSHEGDFDEINNYVKELYRKQFKSQFDYIHTLADMMYDDYKPLSDEVLEQILTDVPLKLFDISECLSDVQARLQLLKLKIKNKKVEIKQSHKGSNMTQTEISDIVTQSTLEDEILVVVYNQLISLVDSEVSYTKELIMGAKKIWDRRRQADSSMPVGIPTQDMPSYDPSKSGKSYIHG